MTKHEQYQLFFKKIIINGHICNNCESIDKQYRSNVLCCILNPASILMTCALIESIEYALDGHNCDFFWGEIGGEAVEFYENNTVELGDSKIFYPMEDLKEILKEWSIFINPK